MKTNDLKGKYEVEENDELGLAMAGQGYDEVRVKDESGDKAYFTITPRIVKAFSRNAHDFAVWDTIKDIAGEKGECYLNTEQIAVLSGCSAGQVSDSRKYWIKLGFLKGEMRKDPGFSQAVWHLSIPDIWQRNIEWCEKHPKIADRLAFRKAHRSLHCMKPSPSEGKPSPSETKKNLIKKNIKDAATPLSSEVLQEIKTEADILQNEWESQKRASEGSSWRGRELTPPNYIPYGDWWHSKTNQHMYGDKAKQKVNTEWLKAFKEWWENDVTTDTLNQVYDAEKSWKGVIGKPSELTTKAIALQVLPPVLAKKEITADDPDSYNKRVLERIMEKLGVTDREQAFSS